MKITGVTYLGEDTFKNYNQSVTAHLFEIKRGRTNYEKVYALVYDSNRTDLEVDVLFNEFCDDVENKEEIERAINEEYRNDETFRSSRQDWEDYYSELNSEN